MLRPYSAYRVYLVLSGASALFFALIATVNIVYQVQVAHLSPLQLVLVGTVLESVCFVFQVPTGVLADVYSRRLAVISGTCLIGVGFVVEGLVPRFETIVLAQVIWGIGSTLTDGAQEAWIVDEVGEAHAGSVFLRGAQVGQVAGIVGIIGSVALASIRLNVPVVTGGALLIALSLALLVIMPETGFTRTPREQQSIRAAWNDVAHTARVGMTLARGRPVLLAILLITAFSGAFSEGFDRLWAAHLLRDFTLPGLGSFKPVVWFGILGVATLLLSAAATEAIRRRIDTTQHTAIARMLLIFNALLIASVLGFSVAGSFRLAIGSYICAAVLRGVRVPLALTWINQHIDSQVRATLLSLNSQVDALGQIAGGPVVGVIGSLVSLRAALAAAALLLTPTLPVFAQTIRRGNDVSALVPERDEDASEVAASAPTETYG